MKNKILEKKVRELASGNNKSFGYIYDNTYKLFYMVIYNIVRNRTDAEDLLQETFRCIVQNIGSYNSSNFLAWGTTIAKNLAYNSYNKHKRETLTDFNEEQKYDKLDDEHTEKYGLYDIAKKILLEDEYKILIMVVVSGYKRKEISNMIDMPISTVSYKYKVALEKLKQYIQEDK